MIPHFNEQIRVIRNDFPNTLHITPFYFIAFCFYKTFILFRQNVTCSSTFSNDMNMYWFVLVGIEHKTKSE